MSTSTTNKAAFYGDFASLSALKRDAKADGQKALRETAQQFESLFTQMMLKSMRQANAGFGDDSSNSSDVQFYQGMYDQQLAVQLSKGKGLGLADMLVQQLTRSGMVKADESATSEKQAPAIQSAQPGMSPSSDVSSSSALSGTSSTHRDSAAVPATSTTSWRPASHDEFVRDLLPHAQQAADKLGVDASTLIAHAALETGWGQHVPCNADGSSSFNLFGIKAGKSWNGDAASASTTEFDNGTAVKRIDKFRSYSSPGECFDDYAALLGGSGRYAAARDSGGNSQQFSQALQRGGYATDPGYAQKLQGVVARVKTLLATATSQGSRIQADSTGRGVS